MESILLIILIGLAGGVAVGLQSPMASMMTQRLGIFESVFIVHMNGAMTNHTGIFCYAWAGEINKAMLEKYVTPLIEEAK